ncbi:MAG: response regulator transcription factor, partial [Pseudonocardiales bacterium]
ALIEAVGDRAPDLMLLGFEPVQVSLALLSELTAPALLLTWSRRRQDLSDAVRSSARGMVHKDAGPQQLRSTISSVLGGSVVFPGASLAALLPQAPSFRRASDDLRLTGREEEILNMINAGMATKQVAASLGIAAQTVKNHLRVLMVKAGVASRAELSHWAQSPAAAMRQAETG